MITRIAAFKSLWNYKHDVLTHLNLPPLGSIPHLGYRSMIYEKVRTVRLLTNAQMLHLQ